MQGCMSMVALLLAVVWLTDICFTGEDLKVQQNEQFSNDIEVSPIRG